MSKDIELLSHTLNDLTARVQVLDIALQELVSRLDAPSRKAIADCVHRRVDELLQDRAERPSARIDASTTSQLAAILDALGHPPKT